MQKVRSGVIILSSNDKIFNGVIVSSLDYNNFKVEVANDQADFSSTSLESVINTFRRPLRMTYNFHLHF